MHHCATKTRSFLGECAVYFYKIECQARDDEYGLPLPPRTPFLLLCDNNCVENSFDTCAHAHVL